eukprot:augustus_masked-scaffold_26-processed-gene-4.21-mRNA-1 protein AED:1.00 eAED:1.00 QI:0/-1/0/0/-1/1/1/0/188
MHEKLSKREYLKIPVVVHDWNNLDHMKVRLKMVVKMLKGEKEMCKIYPELNDDLAVELEMLRTRVSDLMKQKRDYIFRGLQQWGLKYIDHVLWVKTTCNGKVRFTLGNMTLKCVEELLICRKGELPVNLEKRNFGKEILMAPSTGNCRKPKEIYEPIEGCFITKTRYLNLFCRKNNLRKGWISVGDEL